MAGSQCSRYLNGELEGFYLKGTMPRLLITWKYLLGTKKRTLCQQVLMVYEQFGHHSHLLDHL